MNRTILSVLAVAAMLSLEALPAVGESVSFNDQKISVLYKKSDTSAATLAAKKQSPRPGAVAQLFDYPGAYSQRWDGVEAGNAPPSAAGRKPKEIVVVGSKAKKRQGGKTTSTDDWTFPEAAANPKPGVQFNPEQLSRSMQPRSAQPAAGSSTQPYIVGPLWNPKSRATAK